MARCRCAAGTCECHLQAGQNITISGVGDDNDPWIIASHASARNAIEFLDTPEIDFTVVGLGITNDPYVVSASLPWMDPAPGLDGDVLTKDGATGNWVARPAAPASEGTLEFVDGPEVTFDVTGSGSVAAPYVVTAALPWVDPTAGTPGQVLAKQADGSWAPAPPATVEVGSIAVGDFLTGDGSAGDPIRTELITGHGLVGAGTLLDALRLCLTTYDDLKNASIC